MLSDTWISRVATAGLLLLLGVASPHTEMAATEQLSGVARCKGTRDCANAVVYIDAIPGKDFEPPAQPAAMNQVGMQFVPRVLPILVGTRVDFTNADPVLHNAFTPDACADRFNLGLWRNGEVRSYVFTRPCVAAVLCKPHPEMLGYVVALPTPYFAVTDEAGKWSIPDVPGGEYTLRIWHPRLKGTSKAIRVPASAPVDFEISP